MMSKILIIFLVIFTIGTTGLTINKIINDVNKTETLPIIEQKILDKISPNSLNKIIPTTKINTDSNQCIVIVSGQKYNVSKLRNTHSGGDIFQCGTDMTNIYIQKHGTVLSLIQKYLFSGSSTNEVLPTAIPQNNRNNEEDEDDD